MASEPVKRLGLPVLRLPGPRFAPRCEICPKIPHGETPKPGNAVTLSAKNWEAFRFHMESKAVGTFAPFTMDPIVRRNAFIIERIREEINKAQGLRSSVLALRSVFKSNNGV